MITTKEKAKFLTDVTSTLDRSVQPSDTVLFYDRFPAGYLLTKGRPLTPTTWIFSTNDYIPLHLKDWALAYYHRKKEWPTKIIRMKKVFFTRSETNNISYAPEDELNEFVIKGYKLCDSTDVLDVFEKNFPS